jgi:hypothetical protein
LEELVRVAERERDDYYRQMMEKNSLAADLSQQLDAEVYKRQQAEPSGTSWQPKSSASSGWRLWQRRQTSQPLALSTPTTAVSTGVTLQAMPAKPGRS